MPSSGFIHGNAVAGSEGSYLNWQVASQDVAGNFSTINWQAGWLFSSSSCRGLRKGSATINGVTVYNDQDPGDGVHAFSSSHDHRPFLQTASGSINVAHNPDGTKAFSATVGMTGWDGGPNLVSNGNNSWLLPTIARFSDAPSQPVITNIGSTSVFVTFSDGGGGAPIDGRLIFWGTDPNTASSNMSSDGSDTVSGLTPGTTYYFWAITHNAAGYSPFSARSSAVTLNVPDAPSIPVLSEVTQIGMTATFTQNFDGGTPILEWQLGYRTVPDLVTELLSHLEGPDGIFEVPSLSPGTTYYFWGRVRNAVGWSNWSPVGVAMTIAGARVKVGAVWKQAIPYVKVAGVWKLARPWSRIAGIWKETV